MLSEADASVDAFGQEGAEESGTGAVDEWLSFCERGFLSAVRLEDLRCVGVVVRTSHSGIEVAVPSGAARTGVHDSVGLVLSPRPCFHSGASGDFVAVNLVELTGDSSDRLELVEEMPVEFVGFDVDGCLLVPPWVLRISPGHLTPPSAPGTTTATPDGERARTKKPAERRAPKQFTPKAARRLAANVFQEIMAARLEDQ